MGQIMWKAVCLGGALALAQSTLGQAETLHWKCDYTSIATPKGRKSSL